MALTTASGRSVVTGQATAIPDLHYYKVLIGQKRVLSLDGPEQIEQEFVMIQAADIKQAEMKTGGIVVIMLA